MIGPWASTTCRCRGRAHQRLTAGRPSNVPAGMPAHTNGGDSPAWSRKRPPTSPAEREPRAGPVPYAELHCHSNFSFLDGASHPEELVEEAARLGLEALALTDHDGFYGVVRFAEAARAVGLPTVFGAELTLGLTGPQNGVADPPTRGHPPAGAGPRPEGYARLARAISRSQMAGPRRGAAGLRPRPSWPRPPTAGALAGAHRLPQGAVPAALVAEGPAAAGRGLAGLVDLFGRDNVAGRAVGPRRPARLGPQRRPRRAGRPGRRRPVVATNNVHYATPARRRWPPPSPRCGPAAASTRSTAGCPAAAPPTCARGRAGPPLRPLPRRGRAGRRARPRLRLRPAPGRPGLPPFPCPDGLDEMALAARWSRRARQRYGPPGRERVPGAYAQIDHELDLIEQLGFPGYFLIVWDIVEFCREQRHLLPGPGLGRQLGGLLRPRHHQRRRRRPRPAVRAVPVARARRPARHRHRHRVRPAGGGHPVRLRPARPAPRRPGRQRHHLPGQVGGPRHGQGARLRPGQQDAWSKQVDRLGPVAATAEPGPTTDPRPGARAGRRRSSTSPATSASTRAAW